MNPLMLALTRALLFVDAHITSQTRGWCLHQSARLEHYHGIRRRTKGVTARKLRLLGVLARELVADTVE